MEPTESYNEVLGYVLVVSELGSELAYVEVRESDVIDCRVTAETISTKACAAIDQQILPQTMWLYTRDGKPLSRNSASVQIGDEIVLKSIKGSTRTGPSVANDSNAAGSSVAKNILGVLNYVYVATPEGGVEIPMSIHVPSEYSVMISTQVPSVLSLPPEQYFMSLPPEQYFMSHLQGNFEVNASERLRLVERSASQQPKMWKLM